jgi:hypothetical protein
MAPWVMLVSFGPLVLVFVAIGLFFRLRPRFKPFVRTIAVLGPSADPELGDVMHFVDEAGGEREGLLLAPNRLPQRGSRVPIVYDSRRPRLVSIDGPLTDGTIMFAVAGATLLAGLVMGLLALVTGTG